MFARGFTGAGVTVAVIDTGIDGTHPDFAGRIVDEQCYCFASDGSACCPNKDYEQRGPGAALDEQGHGTNVTGIIASAGTIAPRGIAPAANVVAIRVTDKNGAWMYASQIISALDFLIAHHPEVRVVNISLGSSYISDLDCDDVSAEMMALGAAVQTLRARGTAVFMSSGNGGRANGVTFPACVSGALAVGAVYDSNIGVLTRAGVCKDDLTEADKVVCFSNSGPNLDFLAPGVFITSTGRGGGTETRGGTSQASPHAAGAAAILFSLKPSLTVSEMEQLLRSTGTTIVDPRNGYARPRIDLYRAVAELLKGTRRRRAVR
jgi:subtilisin family serine protease